jgi:hypothetical protein
VDRPLLHLHQVHLVNGMDLMKLVLHLYVVGNFLFQHLLVVVHQDVLQNLDAQNLDELPPFLDEVHLGVVLVDAELRHLLRMDYFLDEVGVELHYLLRMDCYQDVVQLELLELHLALELFQQMLLHLLQPWLLLAQPFQHRVMPLALQDQRRVLLRVLLLILDLLQLSSLKQRSSLLLLS